ncbi:MAG: type II secretion system F family protein, partial [Desulfobacteria bacterium]
MTMAEGYIPIIIAVVGFLSISLLCLGILQYARLRARKRATIERIQEGGKTTGIVDTYSSLEITGVGQSWIVSLLARIGRRIAGKKAADLSELRPMFLKAGIRWANAVAVFWGTKVILAVLLPACFLVARVVFSEFVISHKVFVAILALTALAGFYLPNAWLRLKIARRKEEIRDGFPDALDLLVVCVEAGMGLDGAINRVAKEIELDNKTLSYEFNLMNLELRAGKPRRDALKNLAMRTDLEDV